jgi:hypothetical protein
MGVVLLAVKLLNRTSVSIRLTGKWPAMKQRLYRVHHVLSVPKCSSTTLAMPALCRRTPMLEGGGDKEYLRSFVVLSFSIQITILRNA